MSNSPTIYQNASHLPCRSGLSDTHLHRSLSNGSEPTQEAASSNHSEEGSDENSEDEEFVYPGTTSKSTTQEEETLSVPLAPIQHHPSPAQLESLYAASSSGDLLLLKKLFRTALQSGDVEAFALANDASSRTGFTALHAAASRGFIDIVKWRESHLQSYSLQLYLHVNVSG